MKEHYRRTQIRQIKQLRLKCSLLGEKSWRQFKHRLEKSWMNVELCKISMRRKKRLPNRRRLYMCFSLRLLWMKYWKLLKCHVSHFHRFSRMEIYQEFFGQKYIWHSQSLHNRPVVDKHFETSSTFVHWSLHLNVWFVNGNQLAMQMKFWLKVVIPIMSEVILVCAMTKGKVLGTNVFQ